MGGSGLSFQVCWWVGALVFLGCFEGLRVVWVFVVVRVGYYLALCLGYGSCLGMVCNF